MKTDADIDLNLPCYVWNEHLSTFPIDIGFIDVVNFDNSFDSNWINDLDINKDFKATKSTLSMMLNEFCKF